jgi:Fe2+ transport system protein FeoA
MTLDTAQIGERLRIQDVAGERAFRRRLLELGLVPGTPVEVKRVAPMGDPFEILVRGCSLSIRRAEARSVSVVRESELQRQASPSAPATLGLALEQGSAA